MKDQNIVVIGGLTGIGRAVAEQAAAAGAQVTVRYDPVAPAFSALQIDRAGVGPPLLVACIGLCFEVAGAAVAGVA